MKKFLFKLGLFVTVTLLVLLSLPLLDGNAATSSEFMAAMSDKHKRLASIDRPKLILAGGSNLIFGVDSETLGKKLNVPVVNLGLRAHLGLDFILNELRDVADKNDVVLLSMEYFMDTKGDEDLHRLASYYNPQALAYYTPKSNSVFKQFFEYRHMLYKKLISDWITKGGPAYNRNDFNRFGDGVKHLTMKAPSVLGSRYIIDSNKENEIKVLNDFYRFAQEKGITVLFTYSPYARSEYTLNQKELILLHEKFKDRMHIKMLGKPGDLVYPDSLFFDNVYHLTKSGRDIHTKKLVQMLSGETKTTGVNVRLVPAE